jgi:PAS domain S-box-containing protein
LFNLAKENMVPPPDENSSHARLCASLIEHSFDIIAVVETNGTFIYASPSIYAVLGYRQEEIIGSDSDQLIHPEDRSEAQRIRKHLDREGTSSTPVQLRVSHHSGEWRILEMVAQKLLSDPDIGGIVVNMRDVTEHRRMEERFEKSFSCNPDAVTITNINDGRFLVVNEGFELHSGYTADEIQGKSVYDLQIWKRPEDREQLIKLLEKNRSVRNFEAEFTVKSGEVKTALVSSEIINLEKEPCMLMVIRDITDIKLTDERLQETANQLVKKNQEVIRKNAALNEVLKHLEHEKTVFRHEVSANLENLLQPLIARLESTPARLTPDDIDKVRTGLKRVLGEEIDDFRNNLARLTPRELDVCELIKKGRSTKEIADELHLSSETVQKHRQAIRKKLQIDRRGLSLASYLRTRM